jgi:hypothetical protein
MSKRPQNPLSFSVGTLPSTLKEQAKIQAEREREYKLYRESLEKATKGYQLVSDYQRLHSEIQPMTNIYQLDDNLNMQFKGHYNPKFTTQIDRFTIQRKTNSGHIINDRHDYVKIVDGQPEKSVYATSDMYGGKSRNNKRTKKRSSRKNRTHRKIRK